MEDHEHEQYIKSSDAPCAECKLYFERIIKPTVASITNLSHSLEEVGKSHERTVKTVHGENYDNGMVMAVNNLEKSLKRLEKLPNELRQQVVKWGFYILGANVTFSTIALTILIKFFGGD